MTRSKNPIIRLATIELIELLLRQGLINPMETVPYLLALQGDVTNPTARFLALKCLKAEGEKRPNMLRQRVCAGVKQAYHFQQIVNSSEFVTAIVEDGSGGGEDKNRKQAICIFAPIFKESIAKSSVQRRGLFKSLLSLFANAGTGTLSEKIPLLSYVAQVLAHLPYEVYSDPLFIIYSLSCITEVQGAQLLDRMSDFLRPYDLLGIDDGENKVEDQLELAARTSMAECSNINKIMNDEGFDSTSFNNMCVEAAALTLLLRLKIFLKKVYALSEAKCCEYNPADQKERPSDKNISLPERMPIFNNSIENIGLKKESQNSSSETKNEAQEKLMNSCNITEGLIKQYAEFRHLMRAGDPGVEKLVFQNFDDIDNDLRRRKKHTNIKVEKAKLKKRKRIDDDDESYVD